MKNLTSKLLLLAFVNIILASCSVNEDDQPVNNRNIEPTTEINAKAQDSMMMMQENEPSIPKPRK